MFHKTQIENEIWFAISWIEATIFFSSSPPSLPPSLSFLVKEQRMKHLAIVAVNCAFLWLLLLNKQMKIKLVKISILCRKQLNRSLKRLSSLSCSPRNAPSHVLIDCQRYQLLMLPARNQGKVSAEDLKFLPAVRVQPIGRGGEEKGGSWGGGEGWKTKYV